MRAVPIQGNKAQSPGNTLWSLIIQKAIIKEPKPSKLMVFIGRFVAGFKLFGLFKEIDRARQPPIPSSQKRVKGE